MPSVEEALAKVAVMSPSEHPTIEDVLAKEGPSFTLKGKTVLVTGASSGIGIDTVAAFASKGARVLVAVRDVEKTQKVLDKLAATYPQNGGFEIVQMELESLASVKAGAQRVLKLTSQLNILVNNAGVMRTPFQLTKDGHEYQFGVNHLGHFLLFKLLLPLLLKSSTPAFQSRVVVLSSVGHLYSNIDLSDLLWTKRKYDPMTAYGQSKTANALMAREIEHQYGKQGLHAWAVHPGGIATELTRHMSFDDLVAYGLFNKEGEVTNPGFKFKSPSQGAATSVWAAVASELEGKGGEYMEDVHIAKPNTGGHNGYAPYIYDDESAHKLWEYSEQAVSKLL